MVRGFAGKMFLFGEHLTNSNTKTALNDQLSTLHTHFQQTAVQNCVHVFPNNDLSSFFIAINQRALKEYFSGNSQKWIEIVRNI